MKTPMFHVKHFTPGYCLVKLQPAEIEFIAKENSGKTDEIINKISVLLFSSV